MLTLIAIINTVLFNTRLYCYRWADLLRAEGTNPTTEHNFDHPYFQVNHAIIFFKIKNFLTGG